MNTLTINILNCFFTKRFLLKIRKAFFKLALNNFLKNYEKPDASFKHEFMKYVMRSYNNRNYAQNARAKSQEILRIVSSRVITKTYWENVESCP